jgi:sugar lactone lactonase YvrE
VEAQPVITQQPTNQTVVAGTSATFSVSVSGTGPFTYLWQFNGTNLPAIITTVAGVYLIYGWDGDGWFATNLCLYFPKGVAVDANGNLFIADFFNNRVRKVSTNGIITTVAGNGYNAGSGSGGYSGDGGAATSAELNVPTGVAVDACGNLFIADNGNNVIRKVSANGIISTVAGNGTGGYSGDGGAATNAELNNPSGVTVDANGNLFIADQRNQRIRKVSTNGIITTVAGNGTYYYSGDGGAATNAGLSFPSGVAVDANGNLFIADNGNNVIRKVSANGIISTVAGNGYGAPSSSGGYSGDGGAATNAELNNPSGVTVDACGNLFIADNGNNVIRKVANYPANQPSLIVNSISTNNAGTYFVIVTSSSGSVTSSPAALTITGAAPQWMTLTAISGGVQLQFTGTPNYPYILESATNFASPINWQPVLTNAADASGDWIFTVTNNPNVPACFYRAAAN